MSTLEIFLAFYAGLFLLSTIAFWVIADRALRGWREAITGWGEALQGWNRASERAKRATR